MDAGEEVAVAAAPNLNVRKSGCKTWGAAGYMMSSELQETTAALYLHNARQTKKSVNGRAVVKCKREGGSKV